MSAPPQTIAPGGVDWEQVRAAVLAEMDSLAALERVCRSDMGPNFRAVLTGLVAPRLELLRRFCGGDFKTKEETTNESK